MTSVCSVVPDGKDKRYAQPPKKQSRKLKKSEESVAPEPSKSASPSKNAVRKEKKSLESSPPESFQSHRQQAPMVFSKTQPVIGSPQMVKHSEISRPTTRTTSSSTFDSTQ